MPHCWSGPVFNIWLHTPRGFSSVQKTETAVNQNTEQAKFPRSSHLVDSLSQGHFQKHPQYASPQFSSLSYLLPASVNIGASLVAQMVKRLPTTWETRVWSLGGEDPLEKETQPTPILLPRKFHGWRSLVGYSPWGRKESDTTERLHFLSTNSI